jgi:hypothetical protein
MHKQANPVQHVYNTVHYRLAAVVKKNSEHHLSQLSTIHYLTDTLKQGHTNPRCQITLESIFQHIRRTFFT